MHMINALTLTWSVDDLSDFGDDFTQPRFVYLYNIHMD